MIDSSTAIDIATFSALEAEIRSLGKMALTGIQKRRPPKPPDVGMGLYYCGFSVVESRSEGAEEFSFAKARGSGIVTTINTKDVSTLIERNYIIAVQGGLPPENFHFSGMSGGPMLAVVEGAIRSWALAGVVYEGPNPIPNDPEAIAGMEMILARRAHFILPDGRLDHERWAQTDMAWLNNRR